VAASLSKDFLFATNNVGTPKPAVNLLARIAVFSFVIAKIFIFASMLSFQHCSAYIFTFNFTWSGNEHSWGDYILF
jgi:hypothetical protein